MQTFGCPVGAKFQITLPKEIRAILGIKNKGEMVGFIINDSRVQLTKARIEPEQEFTEDEWKKILKLAHEKPDKTFKIGTAFLKDLKAKTRLSKKDMA